jgi:Tfp pilus assembly protein PilF
VSLLLDALRKAELAKQQNPATAPSEPPSSEYSGAPLSVEPPNITRDHLPDITQPLEILSTDLPSAHRAGNRDSVAPAPATLPPMDIGRPATNIPATDNAERRSARALFEAKTVDYNPRRPFYWTAGALGGVALFAVAYFAYQLYAPRPAFYTGPAGNPPAKPIAVTPIAEMESLPKREPQPVSVPTAAHAPAVSSPPVTNPSPFPAASPPSRVAGAALETRADPVPSAPSASARADALKPQPTRVPAPARQASRTAPPAMATAPEVVAAPREPQTARAPRLTPTAERVDSGLERGWEALQAGDLGRAKDEYLRVLKANPINRDALLGVATIEARNQDIEGAEARYLKVLEIDPRDPYAHAGLAVLRGPRDAIQSESKLKNLLAQQPDALFVHFALGNQYAAQTRWADAQASYFKAYSSDPDNPDYAFNLAVSLDQLHEPRAALEYYRRALALSGQRAVGFNQAQVQARIRELAR